MQRPDSSQMVPNETPAPLDRRLPRHEPPPGWPKTLGALSLALGVPAVVAPRATARLIGTQGSRAACAAICAVGLREIGVGIGLLATKRAKGAWTWFRVAGDALDLALLLGTSRSRHSKRARVAATLGVIAAISLVDVIAAVAQRET
jgi:hypothetical protein